MLSILILGALSQEGQKPRGILVAVSDLTDAKSKRSGESSRGGERENRSKEKRGEERRKIKSKPTRDPTTMSQARGAVVTREPEAGGGSSPQAVREGDIYLHALPGRLSDQTVRE